MTDSNSLVEDHWKFVVKDFKIRPLIKDPVQEKIQFVVFGKLRNLCDTKQKSLVLFRLVQRLSTFSDLISKHSNSFGESMNLKVEEWNVTFLKRSPQRKEKKRKINVAEIFIKMVDTY